MLGSLFRAYKTDDKILVVKKIMKVRNMKLIKQKAIVHCKHTS